MLVEATTIISDKGTGICILVCILHMSIELSAKAVGSIILTSPLVYFMGFNSLSRFQSPQKFYISLLFLTGFKKVINHIYSGKSKEFRPRNAQKAKFLGTESRSVVA